METDHDTLRHTVNSLIIQSERITISTEIWTHRSGQRDIVYPVTGEDREEVVFRIQGYVLRADLPPINREEQLVMFYRKRELANDTASH